MVHGFPNLAAAEAIRSLAPSIEFIIEPYFSAAVAIFFYFIRGLFCSLFFLLIAGPFLACFFILLSSTFLPFC
jgi:hypothetical protein